MMIVYSVLGFFALWLAIVSFILYKTKKHYAKLISRTKKHSIDDILDTLLEKDHHLESELVSLKKHTLTLEEDAKFHYQKIGFLRFNPFERMGGEQSFIIALLDREDNGIVLNFLYTREGIRVYSKRVKKGVSDEYELSSEEKEVIKKAK